MAVEHGLPLFLDLPPPALLGMLHFVKHVGSRVRTGQNIVSIGKRLLVLKTQSREKKAISIKRYDVGQSWVYPGKCIKPLVTCMFNSVHI